MTTRFVHDLIEKLKELTLANSSDENLGLETRKFLASYNHPTLAAYWWNDISPAPPRLESEYIAKVLFHARRKLSHKEIGNRIRKFTHDFWNKPGHTVVWTRLNGNTI